MGIELLSLALALIVGFALGLGAAFLFRIVQTRTSRELATQLLSEREGERRADMESVIGQVKASFGTLSLEALSRSTEEFLKLAKARLDAEREVGVQELEARKGLIDQQLQKMTLELEGVGRLMRDLEKDRVEKFGELTKHLQMAGEQTARLVQTTAVLREALAGAKARGQWGERMAEDILRIAGLAENVSYVKQRAIEGIGSRPDFTFLLPKGLTLNMDVKFPFDNYVRFLEAQSDAERSRYRADFLRDVKAKVREATTRDYINPEQHTVDYVLLFVPNEQVYAFIQEQDGSVFEEAIRQHVICCSPTTLFAVLAVVRQAVDSFALEQTSNEVISLLGSFRKQWDEFLKRLEVMGRRIDELSREFETLNGTRRRQLEKPLRRIEEIRNERGLEAACSREGAEAGSNSGRESA